MNSWTDPFETPLDFEILNYLCPSHTFLTRRCEMKLTKFDADFDVTVG